MSYQPASGYETVVANNPPGNKGPLRFEEGVATDTDVPTEFGKGAYGDTVGAGPRQKPALFVKDPAETMRERAHVGSASWVEGQAELGDFVQGAGLDHSTFERVYGSESRLTRPNVATVGRL